MDQPDTTAATEVLAVRTIEALAASFPSLRGKPGVSPWDPILLLQWSLASSHGEVLAVKFVLGVWNPGTDWGRLAKEKGILRRSGTFARFDLMEAAHVWDQAHLDACAAWLRAPFFP